MERKYNKIYLIAGIPFTVEIKADIITKIEDNSFDHEHGTKTILNRVIDYIYIISISIYNEDENEYENVYSGDRLYELLKEAFLDDDSVKYEITEGS